MLINLSVAIILLFFQLSFACTDFQMNFTNFVLSARTTDLGIARNWSIVSWPRGEVSRNPQPPDLEAKPFEWKSVYGVLSISANWLGDANPLLPFLYSDAINEAGISCGLQTLIDSRYETPKVRGINIFNGKKKYFVAKPQS